MISNDTPSRVWPNVGFEHSRFDNPCNHASGVYVGHWYIRVITNGEKAWTYIKGTPTVEQRKEIVQVLKDLLAVRGKP